MSHCGACGKSGALKQCSRCKTEKYCSVECQRGAWGSHKAVCLSPPHAAPAPSTTMAADAPLASPAALGPDPSPARPDPAVMISCSPCAPVFHDSMFLYGFANVDPRDLCGYSRSAALPTRALHIGASDLTSLAHTAWRNQSGEGTYAATPLHIVCCDIEAVIVARHLAQLELLLSRPAAGGRLSAGDARVMWEVKFSVVLTRMVAQELRDALHRLVACVSGSAAEGAVPFDNPEWRCSALYRAGVRVAGEGRHRVASLLRHWARRLTAWLEGPPGAASAAAKRALHERHGLETKVSPAPGPGTPTDLVLFLRCNQWCAKVARDWGMSATGRPDILFPVFDEYREKGVVEVYPLGERSGSRGGDRDFVNPTFWEDEGEEWMQPYRMHYALHPYACAQVDLALSGEPSGWRFSESIPSVRSMRRRGGAAEKCPITLSPYFFEQFALQTEALLLTLSAPRLADGSPPHGIILFAGDGFRCCDLLRRPVRAWGVADIPAAQREAAWLHEECGAPLEYDYIDTSNIGDLTGVLPLLCACAPLLSVGNPRAVLATDLMKGPSLVAALALQFALPVVPLWLVPYIFGVALDELRMPMAGTVPTDWPSRFEAWTVARPQLVTGIAAATLGAQQSPLPLRWRVRPNLAEVDPLSLEHSPHLIAALRAMCSEMVSILTRHTVGPATFVRLLECLARTCPDLPGLVHEIIDFRVWAKEDGPLFLQTGALARLHGLPVPCESGPEFGTGLYEVVFQVSDPAAVRAARVSLSESVGKSLTSPSSPPSNSFHQMVCMAYASGEGATLYCTRRESDAGDITLTSIAPEFLFAPASLSSSPTLTLELCPCPLRLIPQSMTWQLTHKYPVRLVSLTRVPVPVLLCPGPSVLGPLASTSPLVSSTTRIWTERGLQLNVVLSEVGKSRLGAAPVSVRLGAGHACRVEVIAKPEGVGVVLATCTLPVEADLNSIKLKVGRKSGTLSLFVSPLPYCPLSAAAAVGSLPRATVSRRLDGASPPVDGKSFALSKDALAAGAGWATLIGLDVWARALPEPVREAAPFHEVRDWISTMMMAKRWRMFLFFRKGSATPSPLAYLLCGSQLHADSAHALVWPGLLCVAPSDATSVSVHSDSQFGNWLRKNSALMHTVSVRGSEEAAWTQHYFPAAVALARITQGLPAVGSMCYCGREHVGGEGARCPRRITTMRAWLHGDDAGPQGPTVEMSDDGLSHFVPCLVFNLLTTTLAAPEAKETLTPELRFVTSHDPRSAGEAREAVRALTSRATSSALPGSGCAQQ